ncbi:LytR C-terminal domain-containing protein [Microbacterium sp. nov. GSS16]|uniref:LytR C-terminal domain-containing protein n=1 Tax=Microbacterium sp. nov. GSS16 TaxID=3019890 RepID=UPI0023064FAA|nr:LytR C-terminal domain-containing protein [Microbacterium sp. nov. GSS16]WCD91575.1 LytR C-terminal domain-containing protein [Microbacterium sp. nov. GSS16]
MQKLSRDRFDDVPHATGRVGAHRAEQPGMNGLVVLLWSAAVALVLIVGGIFVSLVMMDRISLFGGEEPGPVPTQPGVVAQIDTSYRVLILNATTEKGRVAEVREKLLADGWSTDDVFGSDGASQEFSKTTVFYVADADEGAALGLADVLGGVDVQQSDFYAAMNDSDRPQLTVVIGVDKATSSAPASEAPAP